MRYTAAVITVSDKGYRGEREDTSGPNLVKILTEKDFEVTYTAIVPDEADMIKAELPVAEVRLSYIGPIVGAHSGPGTLAVFFMGKGR